MRTSLVLALAVIAATPSARPAAAQAVTIDLAPGDSAFDYQAATPISPTTVIQMYFTKADRGAALGYALVIRGPAGWYNAKSRIASIPADSLPPDGLGERWQVGARRYDVRFDRHRATLAVFDTTVDLAASRVVLVTLPDSPDGRATVTSGAPTTLVITRATPQPVVEFLRRAADVREFAALK